MKKQILCSLFTTILFFSFNIQFIYAQQRWPEFSFAPIAVDKGTIKDGVVNVAEGDVVTITLQLDCANLKQGLAPYAGQEYGFMAPAADIISFNPATFTAEEANADPTVEVKVKPSQLGSFTYGIYGGSNELEGIYQLLSLSVTPKKYTSLADYIAEHPEGVKEEGLAFVTEGDFVVTHTWTQTFDFGKQVRAYVQDATAGVLVHTYSGITAKVGDHFSSVKGILNYSMEGNGEGVYGLEGPESSPLIGTASKNEAATPTLITTDQVAAHHGRLVQIDAVRFGETGSFTECDTVAVTIGDLSAHICLFPESDLVGEIIPIRANITGILRSVKDGAIVLSPRSKSDIEIIEAGTTALENTVVTTPAVKVMENGHIYIIKDGVRYTVLGRPI